LNWTEDARVKGKNNSMSNSELRKFGLLTALLLVVFFDGLIPWLRSFKPPVWPLVAAALLVLPALAAPNLLRPVYRAWMAMANVLGWINTRIILSLIFFLIFLPVGIVIRMIRDPMRRQWDNAIETYRTDSTPPKVEHMERPF
jgi:O-antigen/teichoic acid export membrane protein